MGATPPVGCDWRGAKPPAKDPEGGPPCQQRCHDPASGADETWQYNAHKGNVHSWPLDLLPLELLPAACSWCWLAAG